MKLRPDFAIALSNLGNCFAKVRWSSPRSPISGAPSTRCAAAVACPSRFGAPQQGALSRALRMYQVRRSAWSLADRLRSADLQQHASEATHASPRLLHRRSPAARGAAGAWVPGLPRQHGQRTSGVARMLRGVRLRRRQPRWLRPRFAPHSEGRRRPRHFAPRPLPTCDPDWQRLHRVDEAIECYRVAIQRKPDHPHAYVNLGNALREKGLVREAVHCYVTACKCERGARRARGGRRSQPCPLTRILCDHAGQTEPRLRRGMEQPGGAAA